MPYNDENELPDRIKKLPDKKRRQWMHVWNSAYQQHKDEGKAFAMANAAIAEEEIPEAISPEMEKMVKDMMADGMSQEEAMAAAKKKMQAMESILASIDETGLVEAAEGSVVEVTIIKAGWSENGRYYSPAVLAQAIPMFEGAPAYLDHPSKSEERDRPNRSVKDIAGLFENVRQEPNGDLKARLRLIGRHAEEMAPLIKEAVQGNLNIGVSINAAGRLKEGLAEGRKGQIVESITSVVSADIVTRPAAGGKFERLVASMDWVEDILKQARFEDWKKYHPEHKEEPTVAELTEEIQAAVQEAVKPFKEELDKAKRRESARGKLEASAIPKAIYGDLMEALAVLEPEDQDKAIEAEVEKLKKLNLRPVVKGAGQSNGQETLAEEFVKPGETVWQYRDRIRGQTALLETKQQG